MKKYWMPVLMLTIFEAIFKEEGKRNRVYFVHGVRKAVPKEGAVDLQRALR